MSLLLDRREMVCVNFQEQEKKKDDILVRGFTGYFGAGFHGKQGWAQEEKGRECSRFGSESDEFSSESSSIGGCSDSSIVDHGGDEEDEVQSRFRSPLCQMDSLEDCLPVKRGLSNHFSGKAKSFGCLSDAISVKDLAKTENPLNKRRRLLLASKNVARNGWHGSFSDFSRQSLLEEKVVEEDEEEEEEEECLKDATGNKESEEEEEEEREGSDVCISPLPLRRKFRSFISPRSLSLSDLHHA